MFCPIIEIQRAVCQCIASECCIRLQVPNAGVKPALVSQLVSQNGLSVCLLLPQSPEAACRMLQEISTVQVDASKEDDFALHEGRGDGFLFQAQVQHGDSSQEWGWFFSFNHPKLHLCLSSRQKSVA